MYWVLQTQTPPSLHTLSNPSSRERTKTRHTGKQVKSSQYHPFYSSPYHTPRQEFLSRRTRAALASVQELLEAEEDELPAPTPRKEREKGQEEEEEEEMQPPPPALAVVASPTPRSQQGQGQESAGRRLSTVSTASSSSSSSVPLIRLTPAAPWSHVEEGGKDKENAPQQPSSSPTSTPSSHKASPASKQRASLTGISGSPHHRSPSPVKSAAKPLLAPFISPLAGGAVRVPTGACTL